MKKAFDANVSRARPRLRVGALTEAADAAAARLGNEAQDALAPASRADAVAAPVAAPVAVDDRPVDLGAAVKARAERARAPRQPAVEAVQRALEAKPAARATTPEYESWSEFDANAEAQAMMELNQPPPSVEDVSAARDAAPRPLSRRAEEIVAQATSAVLGTTVPPSAISEEPMPRPPASTSHVASSQRVAVAAPVAAPVAMAAPVAAVVAAPVAHAEPPAHVVEVQTPAPELPRHDGAEAAPELRRERLKERLRAVRENPRPEPLPPTVAEAGVLAVERIATLQAELQKLRAVNLALTQDLEGARRQAEKATEEARLRMDESRRLTSEMEGRVRLLQDLERELSALEGERDDALLALQEARQGLQGASKERAELEAEIARRDQTISECLAEEERLCAELEMSREDAIALRRSVETLKAERDTLARQVSELTAERAELLEARKALEAVHRALHQAVR